MVARIKRRPPFAAAWHAGFLAMVPIIRNYARGAFSRLNPEARQDMVQEVIANAMVAYVRLVQQGRVALAYPTVLARFAISQVRDHRRVGAKLNIKDVMSPYCQQRKHVVVERLDHFDEEENAWQEAVVQDTRCARAGHRQLPRRFRRLAEFAEASRPPHRGVPRPRQPHRRSRPQVQGERGAGEPVAPRACRKLAAFHRR